MYSLTKVFWFLRVFQNHGPLLVLCLSVFFYPHDDSRFWTRSSMILSLTTWLPSRVCQVTSQVQWLRSSISRAFNCRDTSPRTSWFTCRRPRYFACWIWSPEESRRKIVTGSEPRCTSHFTKIWVQSCRGPQVQGIFTSPFQGPLTLSGASRMGWPEDDKQEKCTHRWHTYLGARVAVAVFKRLLRNILQLSFNHTFIFSVPFYSLPAFSSTRNSPQKKMS